MCNFLLAPGNNLQQPVVEYALFLAISGYQWVTEWSLGLHSWGISNRFHSYCQQPHATGLGICFFSPSDWPLGPYPCVTEA